MLELVNKLFIPKKIFCFKSILKQNFNSKILPSKPFWKYVRYSFSHKIFKFQPTPSSPSRELLSYNTELQFCILRSTGLCSFLNHSSTLSYYLEDSKSLDHYFACRALTIHVLANFIIINFILSL